MNKNEFVNQVYNKSGLSKKDCRLCLDSIINVIKDALSCGESVTLTNFGKFKVTDIKPKTIYNFQSGENAQVGARRVPSFKASSNLKRSVK